MLNAPRLPRFGVVSGFFAAALFLTRADSAVLSTSNQTALAGQTIVASLAFSAESRTLSGIQFDIEWDQNLEVKLIVGDRLRQARKLLNAGSTAPNMVRCVVVGINQDTLADGELLKLFISVDPNAAAGSAQVRFTNLIATGPQGDSVPLSAQAATVQIQTTTSSGNIISLAIPAGGVLNAASFLPGPIAPGEIITLLGSIPPLAPTVLFNGTLAPILYAGANQVNAIVPFGLDVSGPANLDVLANSVPIARLSVPVTLMSPAIFTQTNTGTGQAAVLNEDYSLNSFSNPARRGSVVMLYGSGFGQLNPSGIDGQVASGPVNTALPVSATIGGISADVLYAGAAPGLVFGVEQINVRVPQNAAVGTSPMSLNVGSAATPGGLTISIR